MDQETLAKFAGEQLDKNKEILASIRAHHPKDVADRATLVTNILIHQQQVESVLLGVVSSALEADDPMEAMNTMLMVTALIKRGHEIPIAIFGTIFTEEERDTLRPFMSQLKANIGAITKNIIAGMD
jgi:hypothetical protein